MNMKNKTIPCLHYTMLVSVFRKVIVLLACCVCLIVEMAIVIVSRQRECGIQTVSEPCFLPFGDRVLNKIATIPLCGVSSRVMLVCFGSSVGALRCVGGGNMIRAGCQFPVGFLRKDVCPWE